jgi:hypothetical protein
MAWKQAGRRTAAISIAYGMAGYHRQRR